MNIKKQTWKNCLVLLPFAIVVCLYELLPLLQLALNSFHDENTGAWSLSNYGKIFSTPLYQASIVNSIRISLISALVGICVAFIAAKSYHDAGEKFQNFFTMVLNMTSNFSGVPLTFGFMILLGNTGVLTLVAQKLGFLQDFNLYSGNGLTLIYIYFQIPLATLLLIPAFLGIKKEWREAAILLHCGSLRYWFLIGIPNLLTSLLGTLSVLFSNALAAYAAAYALLLSNYALLPLQISSKFKGDVRINKELGGALSVVMICLMVAATLVNNYLTKKHAKGAA